MTSSKNNKTIINKIFLTCLLFMLVFSAFNITKVFAGIDNIVIQDVSIVDKSSTVDASITGHNRDSLATNITYHNVNDYVEFKITLKNNDSKKYTIKTITDNNSNSNIIYEYDKHENEELASGSEKDLNIKITYKNEVTNKNGRNVNNNVQIKITFIDEDGNEDDKVIPINPQTSDNLIIYIITGSLSLIGLIVLLNNKKINKLLLMLLLITPFATKALTLSYVINFNSSVKLYDKMLVTIDVNGNKEERLIPYNSKITEPDPVSIPGYEFVGWYSGDSVFNFNNNIIEDTVIEAKYNLLTYNITYNLNGGTVSGNPTTYTVEDEFTLNNPTKRGYTFAGWTGSNGDNLQTRVTVNKGTINNLNFVAHFTESTDTPYLVVHKYKNLNSDTYTTEEEHLKGATNSTVYPQIKHKDGFIDPTVQSLTISPDGDSEITYTYNRETYSYSYDSNVNSDLAVGTYEYETPIIVTPKEIPGYTFTKWEDNSTNNPRTIILSSDTTVVPTYTANTNTEYTVIHRYQTLNNTYEEETITGHGTTDTTVPAPRQPRTGFVTPTEQNVTILGDGSGSVTYTYNRITYNYSYDSNVISSKEAGTYMHGTEITVSPKEIPGYTFIKWEDDSTTVPRTITLTSDLAVGATYETNGNTPYTVNHKYQNLDSTYTTETKTEHGETGATVNAPRQPRTGFETPNEQSVTINGDGSSEVTYTYDRETYSYTYDSNVISSETAGNKMYGTEIAVRPKEIPGYTFAKWEDNSTDNPRTITLTGALNVVPTYTANADTAYTVNHYTQKLDGTYEIKETEVLTGTTDTDATPLTKSYTGFTSPSSQTKNIEGDGSTEFDYLYLRDKYTLTIDNPSDVVQGDISGQYYYEEQITLTAKDKEGYTFTKWSNNETTKTITITMGTSDITVGPVYEINSYTITFDTQGGTPVSSIVQDYGEPIGTIEVTTKEGFTFDGWFTDPDAGTEIDENTLVTGNDTYYAHWTEIVDDIICIKATTLTSEECQSGVASGKGCKGTGYASGETITYGNISSSDTIQVGDSYLCDVDGTGYNERFYYLRTVDNKAVLILDHSVAEKIYGRDDPASHIPTISTWSNLPITFDDNKAARFPTKEDLQEAIGGGNPTVSGALDPINFIFEKTSYANTSGGYGSTVWILYNDVLDHRYHKDGRNVADTGNNTPDNSYNSVRPVIEVPIINLDDSYVVRFNAGSGTVTNEYVLVERNHSLGTLPTATYGNMILEGWYKENTHINKISSSTVPTGYETYYANWKTKVEDAILQEDSFSLELNKSEQIVITNESDLEPYTYSSSDDTVVTVDSNGQISSVDYGTANIIITGEISGTTKVIPVEVTEDTSDFIVTFESLGGPDVAPMNVPRHTAIGTLPAPTWTDYELEGWYTDTSFTEKITPTTIINGNRTFYARWVPSDAVAVIGTSDFYTSIQAAIDESTTTKTIKVLKDVTVNAAIDLKTKNTNKDIVLDLNGHTITGTTSGNTKFSVFENSATLEITNGTITSDRSSGTINNNSTGTLVVNDVTIRNTGDKQAVNNEGGNVIINGLVASSNTSGSYNQVTRGTVQNNSGTTTIISANITNSTGAGVSLGAGTLTVGTKDDIYDTDNIIIQGTTYGIISKTNYNLYDGMIKGKTKAVEDETKISGVEDNSTKVNDEVDGYKRLYYTVTASSFKITFDPTDGTVSPTYINVNNGDSVASTDVPTPTRGIYTFDGWYYDDQYQNIVTYPFTPNENKTLYAKWSYTPSDTPVSFNMTNDVMMDYYSNINTWKNQYTVSGTKSDNSGYTEVLNTNEFQASMRANFDAHNCSYCGTDANQNSCSNPSSGEYCERPKGYDTGLGETVNVYEYDTNTHEKTLITYTTNNNGIIYNMIPGKTYRWESASDSNVYGYVAPTARRRTIYSSVRNVRDLGGMEVSFTRNNTTKTGTLKYGKLFRGAELSGGQSDVNSLTKLGITREVDLRVKTEGTNPKRLPKHDKCDSGDCVNITTDQDIIMTNYLIYPDYYSSNFTALRDTMRYVMQSVVDGDNIYFHCTIGTDRTGTLAYFLEGLLGVSEEEKLEDYELSYFYGMLNRHRFHDNLVSGANINPRFLSMYKTYDTNEKIYNLYMSGLSSEQKQQEDALIEQFRDAMINYN